jgi:hypothetical protein
MDEGPTMIRAWHIPTPRFSLRSLFVLLTATAAFIALNARPRVEFTGPVLCFGSGEFDVVGLTRGWPFDYLLFEQFLPQGTGAEAIVAGWPWNLPHVPLVTHPHRLIANLAICAAIFVGFACARACLTGRRKGHPGRR